MVKRIIKAKSRINVTKIMIVFALFFITGCNKDDDNSDIPSEKPINQNKVYVSDISDEVENAIMYFQPNGNYVMMIFDAETKLPAKAYFNTVTKEDNDGVMVIYNDKGFPHILKTSESTCYFANYKGNKVDIAIADKSGDTHFYWGIESNQMFDLSIYENGATKLKMSDAESYSHISWGVKAIGLTIGAVGAAALIVTGTPLLVTVGVVSAASLILSTALSDVNVVKSTTKTVDIFHQTLDSKSKTFAIKNINIKAFGLGILIDGVADGFEKMANDEITKTTNESMQDMSYWEYQLALDEYFVIMDSEPATKTIKVNSRTTIWTIENPNVDWCRVKKGTNNTIVITTTKRHTELKPLQCSVILKVENNTKIQPVTLTIYQQASFDENTKDLIFTCFGGEQGYTLNRIGDLIAIESLNPDWCQVSYNGINPINVIVNVKENPSLTERQSSIIASFDVDGSVINRQMNVKQEAEIFTLSTYKMGFKKEGGTSSFTINTSLKITEISPTQNWCKVSYNANAPKVVTVTVENNETIYSRNTTIFIDAVDPVTNEKRRKAVYVSQEADEEEQGNLCAINGDWSGSQNGSVTTSGRGFSQTTPINGKYGFLVENCKIQAGSYQVEGILMSFDGNMTGSEVNLHVNSIVNGITHKWTYTGQLNSYKNKISGTWTLSSSYTVGDIYITQSGSGTWEVTK